jgi:hypothetical protein
MRKSTKACKQFDVMEKKLLNKLKQGKDFTPFLISNRPLYNEKLYKNI